MLAFETLQFLFQKAQAGDPTPAWFCDACRIWDPRRAGSVLSVVVGPQAAGNLLTSFTVPRDGLYAVRIDGFMRLGAVRTVDVSFLAGATTLAAWRAVLTSQGLHPIEGLWLLQAGDLVAVNAVDAWIAGDEGVFSIVNFEVAAG